MDIDFSSKPPVHFVAFQEQDNLGVGYLASALLKSGYDFRLLDFKLGANKIHAIINDEKPLIVGFSIIFQYHIDEFRDLIQFLRESGIKSHFCAGGHYPSLRSRETLEFIPGLDSVALYEGENTFLELTEVIYKGRGWKEIDGLAYGAGAGYRINPLRPLEKDLDTFPPPARPELKDYIFGKKYATILAGRGCIHDCSFCSIRQFYSKPPGKIKRVRRPEMVVREMELLNTRHGAEVFMFQDDDFPVGGVSGTKWASSFCSKLQNRSLDGKLLWKINCRPDEIKEDLFALMRNAGLFIVYLGIEAGTDEDLEVMNKHITAEENLAAVEILKKLDIGYDFGFMLLNPYSNFRATWENLEFLERLCGDGSSSVTFCKMLPYAGTAIEKRLGEEGRLKGPQKALNYDFLDKRLDIFYYTATYVFHDWMSSNEGLHNLSRWARHSVLAAERFTGRSIETANLRKAVESIVAETNLLLIDLCRQLLSSTTTLSDTEYKKASSSLRNEVKYAHKEYVSELRVLIEQANKLI